jgi:hypothetical protein
VKYSSGTFIRYLCVLVLFLSAVKLQNYLLIFLADDDTFLENEQLTISHLWLFESMTPLVANCIATHKKQTLACDIALLN